VAEPVPGPAAPPADTPPSAFERDYGCTEAEWLRWLPVATQPHLLSRPGPGTAGVQLPTGTLTLHWAVQPPRRIALVVLPRLAVRFVFDGVAPEARAAFMRRFDLATQRGGG
jgi:hypothetical protein